LGGIAIAVGAMVDAAIVVVEQTHKKLEEWERTGRKQDYHRVVIDAVKEVGGPSFFALLVIAVAFLPVLTLEAQEGRLFKPLAYTKTFSMIIGSSDERSSGGHDSFRRDAPDQQNPDQVVRAGMRTGVAMEVVRDRRGRSRGHPDRSGFREAGL
jgi:hypothetical protein